MNIRKTVSWVVVVLVALGALCIGLRVHAQRELRLTSGESLWRLTYAVKFHTEKPGARISVAFPHDTRHSRVYRQDVLHSDLRTERLRSPLVTAREISLVAMRGGEHSLTAKFDIHMSRKARFRLHETESALSADARAQWLRSDKMIQTDSPQVLAVLQMVRQQLKSPDDLVQALFNYCHIAVGPGTEESPEDAAGVLEQKSGTALGRARALVALCRASKIPARLITGLEVKEDESVQPRTWTEVLVGSHWEPFDPDNGFARELPHNVLPVRRDGGAIVRLANGRDLESNFSIVRLPSGRGVQSRYRGVWALLDLTRLPLEMHEVLALILLLPLGGLVTSFFRTIVGVRTFGTFTPTLIALSFVFADWRTGIFVFVVVIGLGLISRSYLERLKLLMVPRLSVILTLVVLCIVFLVSLLDYLHLTPGAQAVLLPMVILTMTVERFYLTTEEDGVQFALRLLAGTVFLALCCYLILRWAAAGMILLRYPEAHLFTIAVLILMGRYTGYRLTELWRFRDLAAPAK